MRSRIKINITAGSAKLYKLLADARRQITGFVSVGQFLGLAVSATYAFSAEAIEPVRLCRFSRNRLHRLLADFPALERWLLQVASNEMVAAQEQMLLLRRKTARERVASFLLSQGQRGAPCGRHRILLHLSMTRSGIADYPGPTVETVSRTLTRFKSEGLLEMPAPPISSSPGSRPWRSRPGWCPKPQADCRSQTRLLTRHDGPAAAPVQNFTATCRPAGELTARRTSALGDQAPLRLVFALIDLATSEALAEDVNRRPARQQMVRRRRLPRAAEPSDRKHESLVL
jgi:CRP/FNR family transcriptional regulator